MTAFTPLPLEDSAVVVVTNRNLTTLVDEVDATTSYIGKAATGSANSASVWQIRKVITSGNDLDMRFTDSGNFSQVWNDRASLSYP